MVSIARRCHVAILIVIFFLSAMTALASPSKGEINRDRFHAVYVPSHRITQRSLEEIVQYAGQTPVNAVVLHVKTPKGNLLWPSENELAIKMGVGSTRVGLKKHVARLKNNHIHTIAKVDVFADNRLASAFPSYSVMDRSTQLPWTDANGLHWSNPADQRVWSYNISLAKELARIGFDEIQFDYVRFPSDGDLSLICYPNVATDFSKSDCIASFLRRAHGELAPLGVSISADLFGLTAWKKGDFGVGQVLEKMAPHLDVICPMFYPSHFPSGFLGKRSPGEFPELIMETSMRSMMDRTDKPIRPWVQGFWYRPEQIIAQIDGIENARGGSWSIWNPAGRYAMAYKAMARRSGLTLTPPRFYPSVEELAPKNAQFTRGHHILVNYTNFDLGYSIISLETPEKGRSRYSSPTGLLSTFEEGIIDHILKERSIRLTPDSEPYTKRHLLSNLLCDDLGRDARRMYPEPIYIDWAGDCIFSTQDIPRTRLDVYATASRQAAGEEIAAVSSDGAISIASISKDAVGIDIKDSINPPFSVFSK